MLRTAAVIALSALALSACTVPADEPTAVQPAESGAADEKPSAPAKFPIKLAAVKAKPKLVEGLSAGPLSCARVTVTNQSSKQVEVNPFYFSLTDTTGEKHDATDALAAYEDQIDTTELAPGEHVKGMVCGTGTWTPKVVAMTNPLFDEAARAEVG